MSKGIEVTVPPVPDGEEEQEQVNGSKTGPGRPTGPAGTFPEDMVPMLINFLKSNPQIRAVPKVVDVRPSLAHAGADVQLVW